MKSMVRSVLISFMKGLYQTKFDVQNSWICVLHDLRYSEMLIGIDLIKATCC